MKTHGVAIAAWLLARAEMKLGGILLSGHIVWGIGMILLAFL